MNLEQLINEELARLHTLLRSAANTDTDWTYSMIKRYNEQMLKLITPSEVTWSMTVPENSDSFSVPDGVTSVEISNVGEPKNESQN